MEFRPTSGRNKRQEKEFKWMGSPIKKVKNFGYLGCTLSANNSDTVHVKEQVTKTNALLGRIWSIGQRLCIND